MNEERYISQAVTVLDAEKTAYMKIPDCARRLNELDIENSDIIDNFTKKINTLNDNSSMLRGANSALRAALEKCMEYYRIELMRAGTPNYEPKNTAIFMQFQELLDSPNQEINNGAQR